MEAQTRRARFFGRATDLVWRAPGGRKALGVLSKSTMLQRLTIGGPNPIHLWEDDPAFREIEDDVKQLTLLSSEALFNLYQIALQVRHAEGHVAEVGVYKGGTARLLANVLEPTEKHLYLFDTFEGMPASIDPTVDRLLREGDFSDTSLADVQRTLSRWTNVACTAGLFPESGAFVAEKTFAMAHVDVDIYQSVLDCCEFFYPRAVPGGVLVFDDYGVRSTAGARKAVDVFFADKPEQPFYLPTGQCVVWRLP